MRRADRLFDIIQILRAATQPVAASHIVSLQASGVPIEGAVGMGYVLRGGFDLPPLMFTSEEVQAIAVALELIGWTGDRGLQEAAGQVRAKITAVLPAPLRSRPNSPFYVSPQGARASDLVCMSELREAIRASRKLRIDYLDTDGVDTRRTIWPLGVAYYIEATLIGAWCELRCDYRHFRTDRIRELTILEESYPFDRPSLFTSWRALHEGWQPSA